MVQEGYREGIFPLPSLLLACPPANKKMRTAGLSLGSYRRVDTATTYVYTHFLHRNTHWLLPIIILKVKFGNNNQGKILKICNFTLSDQLFNGFSDIVPGKSDFFSYTVLYRSLWLYNCTQGGHSVPRASPIPPWPPQKRSNGFNGIWKKLLQFLKKSSGGRSIDHCN